jgi:gamma-glutamyltranspeptidase/glutathione hydrolase
VHTVAEAFNLCFADREAFYGDPRQVDVPAEALLSKAYADARRARLDPERAAGRMPEPGNPFGYEGRAHRTPPVVAGSRPADTTYGCVIDAAGNAFSATPSDTLDWSPIVPGLGLMISARGVQSRLETGHPSAIGPGRRPRLTPAPGLACKNGRAFMTLGTPGGDVQTQTMLQVFMNVVEFGLPVQLAIETPRFATFNFPNSFYPYTYVPGLLKLEGRFSAEMGAELEARGHTVSRWADWDPSAGACSAIVRERSGLLAAGADPRRYAYAGGW